MDDLNRTATEMALDILNGEGSDSYRVVIKRLFKASPTMIDDVAPEYQEKLRKELDETLAQERWNLVST